MLTNGCFPNNIQQPLFAPATQRLQVRIYFLACRVVIVSIICIIIRMKILTYLDLQQDDLDFNEIFSEYFINEFDDPLNAYTNSMANNYNNLNFDSNSMAQAYAPDNTSKANNNKVSLPTGGIRTVFHGSVEQTNVAAPPVKKPKGRRSTNAHDATFRSRRESSCGCGNSSGRHRGHRAVDSSECCAIGRSRIAIYDVGQ